MTGVDNKLGTQTARELWARQGDTNSGGCGSWRSGFGISYSRKFQSVAGAL